MPRALTVIPQGVPITDSDGAITIFFRLLWNKLIIAFPQSPTVGSYAVSGQTAALPLTTLYTTTAAGLYRVSFIMRKTVADGVSSSLTLTIGWVRAGLALTAVGVALVTDTTSAYQQGSVFVRADAGTNLSISLAYASNTPAQMVYEVNAIAELMATS